MTTTDTTNVPFEIIDTPAKRQRGPAGKWRALFEEVMRLPPGKSIKVEGHYKKMGAVAQWYSKRLGRKFTVSKLDDTHVAISLRVENKAEGQSGWQMAGLR